MKTVAKVTAGAALAAMPAWGAGTAGTEEAGILVYIFFGIGALIVVCQAVPGLFMLFGMLKGLFSTAAKPEEEADVPKA